MKRSGKTVIICAALYFILFVFIQCGQDDQEAETTQAQSELADDQNEGEDAILLDSRTRELIGLKLAEVKLTDLDESFPVPGRIISNENNEVHVNTLIPARVSELMAKWGETVKKGQPLICLESIDLGRKRADHQRAMAELELAETEYNRNKNLYDQQAVSQRQFLEAEAKKREAEINVEYTLKMLMLTGLSENDVLTPPDEHQVISGCSVHLVSPIDGEIIERDVIKGEQVEPGDCLFRILDLSSVWIEADIFEKDLANINKGGRIKISVPAYPDKTFYGTIFFIGGALDEKTRTIQIRSEVENPKKLLKPGMYASIDVITGEKTGVMAVPEAAILSDDNVHYVFVQEGPGFHRHVISIGARSEGLVEVISGLEAGAFVVVQGNYQLKSRMLMEAVDEHAGHIH